MPRSAAAKPPVPPTAPGHPMRLVMRRTGLSADVLRAWEKRYGAVTPERSPGGHRLYSDADLERLGLLQRLTEGGHAIGQVARLGGDHLRSLLAEEVHAEPVAAEGSVFVPRLLAATAALDGQELQRQIRRAALNLGTVRAIELVVAPFLQEIGARWHRGELTPAHEHMATAVLQRTLPWTFEVGDPPRDAPVVVTATTQGERHELGLLMVAAAAAAGDWRVVYLGADLPVETIVRATRESGARVLAISAVSEAQRAATTKALRAIRAALDPSVAVALGGRDAHAIGEELAPLGVRVFGELSQFEAFLRMFPRPLT